MAEDGNAVGSCVRRGGMSGNSESTEPTGQSSLCSAYVWRPGASPARLRRSGGMVAISRIGRSWRTSSRRGNLPRQRHQDRADFERPLGHGTGLVPDQRTDGGRPRATIRQVASGPSVCTQRLLAHAVFTPGQPGWLEGVDAALALKPDSMKGYTIGDNTHKQTSLFPPSVEKAVPNLRGYVDVSDVGQAAKDWPQLNFIIYHSGYRYVGDMAVDPELALAEFGRTGRIAWVSDLADIPDQYGVTNVYGDLGQVIAMTLVAQPRLCAAVMGILLKGLGAERVCWGPMPLWTGSPQWQIEGLRRLEIPDDMQKKFGFAPLGPATGDIKDSDLQRQQRAALWYRHQEDRNRPQAGPICSHQGPIRKRGFRAEQPPIRICERCGAPNSGVARGVRSAGGRSSGLWCRSNVSRSRSRRLGLQTPERVDP